MKSNAVKRGGMCTMIRAVPICWIIDVMFCGDI